MPSSTSSFRPWALLFGVALFATADQLVWNNRSAARFLLRYQPIGTTHDSIAVSARIRLIEDGGTPVVVFLGSSQVREGVDCDVVTATWGQGECVNLGIGGGSPLDMLHVSREMTRRRAQTTVVSIFPGVLHKGPKSGFIDTQTIRAIAQSGAAPKLGLDDVRLLGLGWLQSLSPTLRHREGLREEFRELLAGWPGILEVDHSSQLRRTTDGHRQPPSYFVDRLGHPDDDTALSVFTQAQEIALGRLIDGEVSRGNRVIVVDFPTRAGFETTLFDDVRSHYARLLAGLRSRTDIRVVAASDLGPLSESDFIEFTHLDSNGRRLVSERLGRLLVPAPATR